MNSLSTGSRAERVEGRTNRDIGKNHGGTVRTDEATCQMDESVKWTGNNVLPSRALTILLVEMFHFLRCINFLEKSYCTIIDKVFYQIGQQEIYFYISFFMM
jgi:hypothetical protein